MGILDGIRNLSKQTKRYLVIAFAWTWTGWIAAYLICRMEGIAFSTDTTVFSLFADTWGSRRFLPHLAFALAVYGPLIGFLTTGRAKLLRQDADGSKRFWHYVPLIPVVSVVPTLVLSVVARFYNQSGTFMSLVAAAILYFVSNLITSGTEEFGWRGVLYPDMKSLGLSFWDIAWKGGIIWALWHFPFMFILYMPLGVGGLLLPTLAGFTASIVAMNYITNFVYEKTRNIWFAVILHALNNTMSYLVALLFPRTPFTLLTSLMMWLIVWWIDKKHLRTSSQPVN